MIRAFRAFFNLEAKRSWTPRNMIVLSVFLVVALYFMQTGIQQYRDIEKNREEFQEIEALKVRSFQNWEQYGGYGFRLYYIPSVVSIFFDNSNLFTELTAQIDVGEKLNIYNSFKGKSVFTHKPGRRLDFAGIFLLFGNLMALFYGFEGFKDREYLRFLSSMFRHRRVYSYIWLSRVTLMTLFFLFVFGSALILLKINGILGLMGGQWLKLTVFLVAMLMMQVIFFSMGSIAASLESRMKGVFIFLGWFVLVYLLPVVFNIIMAANSRDMITNYQAEYQKLAALMDFETEVVEKLGNDLTEYRKLRMVVASPPDEVLTYRRLTGLYYWVNRQVKNLENEKHNYNYFKDILSQLSGFREWLETQKNKELSRIKDLEEYKTWIHAQTRSSELLANITQVRNQMMAEYTNEKFEDTMLGMEMTLVEDMQGEDKTLQILSGIFPTTFYLALNNEISSRGYQGVIDFHRYAREIKRKFFHFYAPQKVKDDEARARGGRVPVENFFEDEKNKKKGISNVLTGVSRFPDNFVFGFCVVLFWTGFIPLVSYGVYRKSLFAFSEETIEGLSELDIELNEGIVNVVLSRRKGICDHLYKFLSERHKRLDVMVSRHGRQLISTKRSENGNNEFVYLCQPQEVPGDIKVKDFAFFFKQLLKLPQKVLDNVDSRVDLKRYYKKRFNEIETLGDKGKILFELAGLKHSDYFLLYNFTNGMELDYRHQIVTRIEELKNQGVSFLYFSNDVSLAQRLGDYISILKKESELMTFKV